MTEPTNHTMADVWEELDQNEREIICMMVGLPQGQLALMKISKIFKAIVYRYHDHDLRLYQQAQQQRMHPQYAQFPHTVQAPMAGTITTGGTGYNPSVLGTSGISGISGAGGGGGGF